MTDPSDDAVSNHVLSAAAVELLQQIARRVEVARRLEFGAGEAVLRSVVDTTVAIFNAEASSIALYDPVADRLVFRVAAGAQGQGVVGLSVPSGEGLVGYVFTTGQALALTDVASDARFGRSFAEQTEYIPRGIVAVPLQDGEGTIGVLEVLDKRDGTAFTMADIELASVFAAQAAVAIRSSRVERETATLIGSALKGLSQNTRVEAVEEVVAAAVAGMSGEDEGRLWALADQVARLRRADGGSVELVTDILAALARQAERDHAVESRFRGG